MVATAQDHAIRLGRVIDTESMRLRNLTAASEQTAGTTPLLRERLVEARLGSLADLSTGWAGWAVGVTASRLSITGFTVGGVERPDLAALYRRSIPESDEALWLRSVLLLGRGYVTTWATEDGRPFLAIEDAREIAHEVDRASGETIRLLKRWVDADGHPHAVLHERDRITVMASDSFTPVETFGAPPHQPPPVAVSNWRTVEVLPNPMGRVVVSPVVLRRSPRDTTGGSDLAPLLPIASAVDKLIIDVMTLSEAAAAPRRWATGVEIPEDPETGEPVDPFTSPTGAPASMAIAEPPESRFGSFPAADLAGTLAALDALRNDLLSRAAVPPHLATGAASGQQVSAESIRAAEAALVARCRDRARQLGDGIGRALRLASEVATGRPEGFVVPTWADPATSSQAADADAAAKLLGAGLDPATVLATTLGWTPDQVAAASPPPRIEVAR